MGHRVVAYAVVVWALALALPVRALPSTAAAAPGAAQAAAQAAPANADCLICHEDASAARADGRPVVVTPGVFEKSIHGILSCVDCHTDLATNVEFPHPEKLARVDCATCHSEAVEKYREGVHAQARASGSASAAACVDCHGMHDILPSSDSQSSTYHLNIAATCSRCHGDPALTTQAGISGEVAAAFADSIHGRALSRSGLTVAPTCSDCHGAHDVFGPDDPRSRVSTAHVPTTCGTCHEGIATKFNAGIHGAVLAKGNTGAPACQTCHTAHAIQRADSTAWQLSVIGQCGTCHADRVATFRDTFHGQVTNLGFRTVAGCADCHGAHEILPASDPRSPISPGRLVETCGRCHQRANENFVKFDPHADKHDRTGSPVLYYAARTMQLLLAGVFTFFGLHTTLWFSKEIRVRRARRATGPRPAPVVPQVTGEESGEAAGAEEARDERAD
ncbi:MAG TPA: hypothetical protein VLD67_10830 [Vicinamibacterales bacterium]|nr:hypothetical protein [Vicinamibacterales bacterium]